MAWLPVTKPPHILPYSYFTIIDGRGGGITASGFKVANY